MDSTAATHEYAKHALKWTPRISEAIPEMNTLNGYYRRDTRICEASPEMNTL